MILQLLLAVWAVSAAKKGRKCSKYQKQKPCNKRDGCTWANGVCTTGDAPVPTPGGDDSKKNKKNKKEKDGQIMFGDGKYPWDGTQTPDYWENCVRKWCQKHSWYGGLRMCHWEPKHGCGCEAMKKDECIADSECEYVGNAKVGCREKVRCNELNGVECKMQDKCALCDAGCVDKCKLGPDQDNLPLLSLQLTSECECKISAFF